MTVFIRHKNGKKAAMEGYHDDLVMARAIATHISSRQTRGWMDVPTVPSTFIADNFRTAEAGGGFIDWEGN